MSDFDDKLKGTPVPPPALSVDIDAPSTGDNPINIENQQVYVVVRAAGGTVSSVRADCYAAGNPAPDPTTDLNQDTETQWSGNVECTFCSAEEPFPQFNIIAVGEFEDPGGGGETASEQDIAGVFQGQCLEEEGGVVEGGGEEGGGVE